MHELSVCRALLRQLTDIADRHGADRVTAVRLQLGPLSGVVPELLAQAFGAAATGTLAEGASLQLESVPLRVRCERCGAESEATSNQLTCAACGDWHTRLLSGDELQLVDIKLHLNKEAAHV